MIFLGLNIVFGSAFVLILKWLQNRQREDIITIGCINYIFAACYVIPGFLMTKEPIAELPAMLSGSAMGFCYFVAYFFVIYAIRYVGVAASTVIGVLSILMPIVFGIFLWGENPVPQQIIGIVLALFSLLLIGGTKTEEGKKETRRWFTPFLLISFFLLAGCSRLSQEAFKYVAEPNQKPTFLLSAFVVASIPSIVTLIVRRKRITLAELAIGVALGLSNLLQSQFLLMALDQFEGFIVFPVVSAGGLVFVTLCATFVFKEKLSRKSYLGIGLASLALVLLNYVNSG